MYIVLCVVHLLRRKTGFRFPDVRLLLNKHTRCCWLNYSADDVVRIAMSRMLTLCTFEQGSLIVSDDHNVVIGGVPECAAKIVVMAVRFAL